MRGNNVVDENQFERGIDVVEDLECVAKRRESEYIVPAPKAGAPEVWEMIIDWVVTGQAIVVPAGEGLSIEPWVKVTCSGRDIWEVVAREPEGLSVELRRANNSITVWGNELNWRELHTWKGPTTRESRVRIGQTISEASEGKLWRLVTSCTSNAAASRVLVKTQLSITNKLIMQIQKLTGDLLFHFGLAWCPAFLSVLLTPFGGP